MDVDLTRSGLTKYFFQIYVHVLYVFFVDCYLNMECAGWFSWIEIIHLKVTVKVATSHCFNREILATSFVHLQHIGKSSAG